MRRRDWLLGGAGATAVAAGAGWQQWRERGAPAAPAGAATDDPAAPWDASFDTPEGGRLALASYRGAPLVLNFWATWCPPCLKEMPALDQLARSYATQGLKVVGLAIDSPRPVRDYLAKNPVSYAIGLAGFEGTELTRRLGNTAGGLPFTVVFNRGGEPVHRKLGETSFAELSGWVGAL